MAKRTYHNVLRNEIEKIGLGYTIWEFYASEKDCKKILEKYMDIIIVNPSMKFREAMLDAFYRCDIDYMTIDQCC